MYSYVARQPILDRELNTQAYELLFRDSLDNVFPAICILGLNRRYPKK